MRTPRAGASSAAASPGTGFAKLVESRRSWPAIASRTNAASRTVFVSGPIWSSELANATSP
jgi:hypothetical protein